MSTSSRRGWDILQDLVLMAVPTILVGFLIRQLMAQLQDPDSKGQEREAAAKKRIQSILHSREEHDEDERPFGEDRPSVADLQLTTYEQTIAMELIAPRDIPVSFDDIGGLEDIIEELKETIIHPLTMSHLYSQASSLLSAPSGVLLYGPPGCGKTMLAKALAHESGACFINLHISTLTEKWYGDSNKLVKAVFSLARKLEPTIVFIDEIDAVLGTRTSTEHEASGMVKAEFMTHWDGLISSSSSGRSQRICILGATNRIRDIDDAILRRMPKKFAVPLPDARQRSGIFELVLRDTRKDPDNFDLSYLVAVSKGLSGSDIKEACRDAAMRPMREYIRKVQADGGANRRTSHAQAKADLRDLRGIRTDDFFRRAGGGSDAYGASAAAAAVVAAAVAQRAPSQSASSQHRERAPIREVEEEDGEMDQDGVWTDASSEPDDERRK